MSRWIEVDECGTICGQYLVELRYAKCLGLPGDEERIIDKIETDGFPKWCPGIELRQILTDPENQPHQFSKQEEGNEYL